jgi:hypothetical protein
LIPRWGNTFKWYAGRADVANYKDVPQDAGAVLEWRARMGDLFPAGDAHDDGVRMVLDSPELLGVSRVLGLAKRYGASHVLARRSPRLALPVVFETTTGSDGRGYIVYETGVSPAATPRPGPPGRGDG